MPENNFIPAERFLVPEDLSTHILDPASVPQPESAKTSFVATLKLGLNNVVFGSAGYRELEPFERHVFNCLLLQRSSGISWPSIVESGLHKRSDHPLNTHSFLASIDSLRVKLRAATDFPIVQQIAESGWYTLHPACKFIDARPQILQQHSAALENEESYWPRKERGAAITVLLLLHGEHPRCTELLQEFRNPRKPSYIRVPNREEMSTLFSSLETGVRIILENVAEEWQPTPAQNQHLIEAAAAYTVLMRGNQGLVAQFTRNTHTWIDEDDRFQIGNVALAQAIEGFDLDRGFAFSTFAVRCIKNKLIRERKNERLIIGSAGIEEMMKTIDKGQNIFWHDHGRAPTYEELSGLIGIPASKIGMILLYFSRPASLDAPVGEGDIELGSLLAPKDEGDNSAAEERVEAIFDLPALSVQEKLALSLRFGVYNDQLADQKIFYSEGVHRYKDCFQYLYVDNQLTITEIAQLLSVPPDKASQWLRGAIEKIRQSDVS